MQILKKLKKLINFIFINIFLFKIDIIINALDITRKFYSRRTDYLEKLI